MREKGKTHQGKESKENSLENILALNITESDAVRIQKGWI